MAKDLLYVVPKEKHTEAGIKEVLTAHPEIKFVSIVGVDLAGHDTDERIPAHIILDDVASFLKGGTQTDGSSVVLPGIATLNNAKVDMVPDPDVKWVVDYNYDNIDEETGKPVGTLRVPCFLLHENTPVDSRSILKASNEYVKSSLLEILKAKPELLSAYGLTFDDVADITFASATELEFWVKTPENKAQTEELSTSQVLQEQYWAKTRGVVRTALEQTLSLMDKYELGAEMGHKEVGGVRGKFGADGKPSHIMEQIEVDWKYADAVQAADNENLVKIIVRDVFQSHGLDVTFLAKPIHGVAGSGEHTHMSISLKTKAGKVINLFAPTEKHFLSLFGYGSLMGILKNYEVINPIVSGTNDALRRLKPGFEAPVCIVTSIGHSVDIPSRNRSILVGVVRDLLNPRATRFELRAPNPHSNTYLVLASMFMASIDGIKYAVTKTADEILAELSKQAGEETAYLEKDRAYRSEEDVFEDFTEEERSALFGKAPATVYENLSAFDAYPEKLDVLKAGDVFTAKLLNSYKQAMTKKWLTEIVNRIIPSYRDEVRSFTKLHNPEKAEDLDVSRWQEISSLKKYIFKDSLSTKSLFTRIKDAAETDDLAEVSKLQVELDAVIIKTRDLYSTYVKNLLDI
ncbi:glutamine synthetase [Clostridium cellulovorans]|uniref:Glutamine synthetase n=1 Tax=Clostridium cellulovorans (strain ATCC 35296 / DSM 3052 / OCM 3 / 743B) TaxID=573061 RepID=D9SKW7_CLOC7|nr:glutamine synthetase [Clostridium cellulovorans]ADL53539.1 glutamine synthetase catalytic region [Clostridium cellulovorans 743B]